eukprot:TRINITY_DN24970_c0_g1_i1.p2 TRINITY_DN24970_c0_g1~~TRINITY_DN24970_c0_g1_i1.p2  ORF type:complete len:202 (+),score=82.58 TRINITY_DN24970_c0_g1_i1:90-695(+)
MADAGQDVPLADSSYSPEDDGVLEADVERVAQAASTSPAQPTARKQGGAQGDLSTTASSEEDLDEQRLDKQLEVEATRAEADFASPLGGALQAQRQADELGQAAARGLESSLEAELASEELQQRRDSKGLLAGAAAGESAQAADPYERQLEADIEDHLCRLRLEERRAGQHPGQSGELVVEDVQPEALPDFAPPGRPAATS